MSLFFSIVIFISSIVILLITYNKINQIRENVVIDDIKKEMESLIAEFNATAVRNIELIEEKINQLQEVIKKANAKMLQLDEKIEKINKPIVIEKIIEKNPEKKDNIKKKNIEKEEILSFPTENIELKSILENKNTEIQSETENKDTINNVLKKDNTNANTELPRKEKLKKLIEEGKSDEEIIQMGYSQSEIALLRFLLKNK